MSATRRDFFKSGLGFGLGAVSSAAPRAAEAAALQEAEATPSLSLMDYEPRSMLVAEAHAVTRARFPVVDVHTHVSGVLRQEPVPGQPLQGSAAERLARIVRWMDELNIRTLVNLTGGAEDGLRETLAQVVEPHRGRIATCTVPSYRRIAEPGYPRWQADELSRAKDAGAIGLKITKTLGLYLREGGFRDSEREPGQQGSLVKIDDPRFDPMWDAAGQLDLPVFIHVADPDAFFTPIDRFNERWEELANHPSWSFYGGDFPSKAELLAARNRVIERHPETTFVCLHVANRSEDLGEVGALLDRHPNMHVEIGARLGELGRQPRRSRRFFEEYQDRVLFGTDASPNGASVPQQDLTPAMFQCYFRFLETLDEYFDYAPSPVPPQGRWKIYGIGLPDGILEKVYNGNAQRLLGLGAT